MRVWSIFFVMFLGFILFEQMPAFSDSKEVLTNESIVKMTRAGLSAGVIVKKIQSSRTNFNTSTSALMELKREKVADEVIESMISAAESSGSLITAEKESSQTDSGDPLAPREGGIYVMMQGPEGQRLVRIDPSTFNEKWGWGFPYGWGGGKKLVVPGSEARIQIPESRPVFNFYFNDKSASPNQVILVRFDEPEDSREIDIEEAAPFDYDEVSPGVFKVTPRKALKNGEYCFYYGDKISDIFGGGSSLKVFDFGIKADGKKDD